MANNVVGILQVHILHIIHNKVPPLYEDFSIRNIFINSIILLIINFIYYVFRDTNL